MFVGHYAASLIMKRIRPSIPLWQLVLGAQLVDVVWAGLLIIGVGKASLSAGTAGFAALQLDSVPFSHSVLATLVWAVVTVFAAIWFFGQPRGAALLVGVVVLSHWILDFLVHHPDLPVNGRKVGLDLWGQHPGLALVIELLLLVIGFASYLSLVWGKPTKLRNTALAVGVGFLVIAVATSLLPLRLLIPVQEDATAARMLAAGALLFYVAATGLAGRFEPQTQANKGNAMELSSSSRGPLFWGGVVLILAAMALLTLDVWHSIDGGGLTWLAGWLYALVSSPGSLLVFLFLLTLGITLIGVSLVIREAMEEECERRYGRFWYLGCETFANGIRVVFLIPATLAIWMGIIAAFHLVWRYAPSQQLESQAQAGPVAPRAFPSQPQGAASPPSADSTVAAVGSGVPGAVTSVAIWVRDAEGRQRWVPADSALLTVVVHTERADTSPLGVITYPAERLQRVPRFEKRSGTFVAIYTPQTTGVDTVEVFLSGNRVGPREGYESPVATPSARPLSQRQNLWFLPIALIICWVLFWPSEPEEKTKNAPLVARTAGTDLLELFFNEVRRAILLHARRFVKDLLKAQGARPEDRHQVVKDFTKEELTQSTFTSAMSGQFIRTLVVHEASRQQNADVIEDETTARLNRWWAKRPANAPGGGGGGNGGSAATQKAGVRPPIPPAPKPKGKS